MNKGIPVLAGYKVVTDTESAGKTVIVVNGAITYKGVLHVNTDSMFQYDVSTSKNDVDSTLKRRQSKFSIQHKIDAISVLYI